MWAVKVPVQFASVSSWVVLVPLHFPREWVQTHSSYWRTDWFPFRHQWVQGQAPRNQAWGSSLCKHAAGQTREIIRDEELNFPHCLLPQCVQHDYKNSAMLGSMKIHSHIESLTAVGENNVSNTINLKQFCLKFKKCGFCFKYITLDIKCGRILVDNIFFWLKSNLLSFLNLLAM